MPHKPASSLLISAADKLHNSRAILVEVQALPPEHRAAYFDRFKGQQATLQYYRRLVDTYSATDVSQLRLRSLFNELARTVSALEAACGVDAETVRQYKVLA